MAHKDGSPSLSDFWWATKWIAFFILLVTVGIWLWRVVYVGTAPGRALTRTMETGNIIHSYEWFFDAQASYEARVAQIKGHLEIIRSTEDPAEKTRLNIELAAMRQSCREIAAQYQANSAKMNKQIFKDHSLPETLPVNACEQQLRVTL